MSIMHLQHVWQIQICKNIRTRLVVHIMSPVNSLVSGMASGATLCRLLSPVLQNLLLISPMGAILLTNCWIGKYFMYPTSNNLSLPLQGGSQLRFCVQTFNWISLVRFSLEFEPTRLVQGAQVFEGPETSNQMRTLWNGIPANKSQFVSLRLSLSSGKCHFHAEI